MFKHIKFAELPVTDQTRALAFYTEKVGLQIAQDTPYQDDWRWIELAIPGAATRILLAPMREADQRDSPRLILVTDDLDASYTELTQKGVIFTQAPTPAAWNPHEQFALFQDSEGNIIMLSQA